MCKKKRCLASSSSSSSSSYLFIFTYFATLLCDSNKLQESIGNMARKPVEIIRLIQLGFPCKITNDKHDINLTDWQRQSDNETKE